MDEIRYTFNLSGAQIRITDIIEDFSPLRNLRAFQRLEGDISMLKRNGWVLDVDNENR